MTRKVEDPVWDVYVEDFNAKEIKIFNVFHSYNFHRGCKQEIKRYSKHKDIKLLEKEIRSWAVYSFKSKCEYETFIHGWRDETKYKKIDVYDQLILNWDSFFKYLVEHKAYFLRRNNNP